LSWSDCKKSPAQDAIAEGINRAGTGRFGFSYRDGADFIIGDERTAFRYLWKKIHGPDAWSANPWVWVVHFDVISTTGKPKSWQGKQLRVDEQATELSNQQTHTS
jgi:hypothetical protein